MQKSATILIVVPLILFTSIGCYHRSSLGLTAGDDLRALVLQTNYFSANDYPVMEMLGMYNRWEDSSNAMMRIVELVREDPENFASVLRLLRDPDPEVRYSATWCLNLIRWNHNGACDGRLLAAMDNACNGLDDESSAVRVMSAYFLFNAISELFEETDYSSRYVQLDEEFANKLAEAIADTADDPSPAMRKSVTRFYRDNPQIARDYISTIKPLFLDESPYIRIAAASAIAQATGDADMTLPVLLDGLATQIPEHPTTAYEHYFSRRTISITMYSRYNFDNLPLPAQAAIGIKALGPGAVEAVPTLLEYLQAENPQVRSSVSEAISEIGEPIELIIPALIELMDSDDAGIREIAVYTLGNMGEEALDALPKLRTLTNDPVREVRGAARGAIDSIEETE